MNIHIKNGRLIDPKNKIDALQDVFIAARKITWAKTSWEADFRST